MPPAEGGGMEIKMKKLADKLADFIVQEGAVPEQAYAVYQYGFQIGLEMLLCFLICLIISIYITVNTG